MKMSVRGKYFYIDESMSIYTNINWTFMNNFINSGSEENLKNHTYIHSKELWSRIYK